MGKIFTKQDRPEEVKGEFIIPDGFTEIGEKAFEECEELTSIVIPDSVTKIGGLAFAFCYNLENVVLSNSLEEIGDQAFDSCSFSHIIIPDSVKEIGFYAFSGCDSLTQFDYPKSLKLNKGMFGGDEGKLKQLMSAASGDSSKEEPSYFYSFGDVTRTVPEYARSNARNKDKMTKANLIWDVVCTLVKEVKPDISIPTLMGDTFQTPGTNIRTIISKADYDALDDSHKKRYFPESISIKKGEIYLTNQWGNNLDTMIAGMESFGIIIEQKKEKHEVHVNFGCTAHSRWNLLALTKDEINDFISDHGGDEIDWDANDGADNALNFIEDNISEFRDKFYCYADDGGYWEEEGYRTLKVTDGDDDLEFSDDQLANVPVEVVKEDDYASKGDFTLVQEVTAKYPSYEADIEIEGAFDANKLSVVDHLYEYGGATYHCQDILYDGEKICLELTYDREIALDVYLKKN